MTPHIHDVSTSEYQAGVTNFTAENLFDLLLAIGNPDYKTVSLKMPNCVFERQFKNNLVDMYDGYFMYQGMHLTFGYVTRVCDIADNIDTDDTLLFVNGVLTGILRSREY